MKHNRKPSASGRCLVNRPCRKCNKVPEIGYTFSQVASSNYICYDCGREERLERARKIIAED